jgi:hypothetical protein
MVKHDSISFTYTFRLFNGIEKVHRVDLDPETLEVIHSNDAVKPEWAFNPCDNCPIIGESEYCPVSLNLAQLVEEFADIVSHEEATVIVEGPERTYTKKTSVQKGLSALVGIYMPTSNCPILDKLRPMTRFHLPFATANETLFRTVASYLTAQYLMMKEGREPDWEMKNLIEIYKQVSIVNRGISRRLSGASQKDANVNAVIILHSFGDAVHYYIENGLEEIKPLYAAFMKTGTSNR